MLKLKLPTMKCTIRLKVKHFHSGCSALSATCSEFFTSREGAHDTLDNLDRRLKPKSF